MLDTLVDPPFQYQFSKFFFISMLAMLWKCLQEITFNIYFFLFIGGGKRGLGES